MQKFNSTLLRERFQIKEVVSGDRFEQNDHESGETVTAASNRMVIPFKDDLGIPVAEYVIRTHTMHTCMRLARELIKRLNSDDDEDPLPGLEDWVDFWNKIITPAEQSFDPDHWCAVYKDGKAVFQDGDHHAFLDVIETFACKHNCDYEQAVALAENAFKKAGKEVRIDHEAKIAAIIEHSKDVTKCGIIMRSPKHTTTYNIRVTAKDRVHGHILPALDLCSEYLEGMHHSFMVGHHESLLHKRQARSSHQSEMIISGARTRMYKIQRRVRELEGISDVHYRPEKPSFKKIIHDTMDYNIPGKT